VKSIILATKILAQLKVFILSMCFHSLQPGMHKVGVNGVAHKVQDTVMTDVLSAHKDRWGEADGALARFSLAERKSSLSHQKLHHPCATR
jgi:hypothetical protein